MRPVPEEAPMPEQAEPQLWVRSDVMPDGTYGVTLNLGDDHAWSRTRDAAVAYAVTCFQRATEAEHDAAVFGLFTNGVGMPVELAGSVIAKDIRPDRPLDHSTTEPLEFIPALGLKVGPFLQLHFKGERAGELTPADLRDHAGAVLSTLAAADLDAAAVRVLTGVVGVDEATARGIVSSLAEHWPAAEPPRAAVSR